MSEDTGTDLAAIQQPAHVVVGPNARLHYLAIRPQWARAKHDELDRARTALEALEQISTDSAKTRRVRERVQMLKKVVRAFDAGYIPIPRFQSHTLDLDVEVLPSEALVAVADADASNYFDEVRFATGEEGSSPRGVRRIAARDPMVIGVVRSPGHREPDQWGYERTVPGREEHFLIAWWQPSDERDDDLF